MLSIPRDAFSVIPLGLEAAETFAKPAPTTDTEPAKSPTLGYLARFAPEKGLHLLCEAFVRLKRQPRTAGCRLRIAGWHGPRQRAYLRESIQTVRAAGFLGDVDLVGEVDHQGKQEFLRTVDVMSVPSPYAEPKGLYVLEALAAGVPVVQPNHGAFPELLQSTGGGLLFEPNDVAHLAEQLTVLLSDPAEARRLGQRGREGVLQRHRIQHTAQATWTVITELLRDQPG
jgi:glycosyltransferase involved in cell wall biosynthesis